MDYNIEVCLYLHPVTDFASRSDKSNNKEYKVIRMQMSTLQSLSTLQSWINTFDECYRGFVNIFFIGVTLATPNSVSHNTSVYIFDFNAIDNETRLSKNYHINVNHTYLTLELASYVASISSTTNEFVENYIKIEDILHDNDINNNIKPAHFRNMVI